MVDLSRLHQHRTRWCRREVVRYLNEASAMIKWIGDHAVLDARPDGEFTLDIEGTPVRGRYLEVVVSWGHAGSEIIPPGSTEVEFLLQAKDGGTVISVEHRNLPDALEE